MTNLRPFLCSPRRILSPIRRAYRLRGLKSEYEAWAAANSTRPTVRSLATDESTGPVLTPLGTRPRVVILADYPDWAQDRAARALSRWLSDEFDFRILYRIESPDLSQWEFDLIFVLFWGETYHRPFVSDSRRVLKQISSHRWQYERKFGCLTPGETAYIYLQDAGTLTVPSRRLQTMFSPYRETVLAPKGFEPSEFAARGRRTGPLRIGWAGETDRPGKGYRDILQPAIGSEFELRTAGGEYKPSEMVDFYNSVDVICVTSNAEGDPLPLLEGMACGCFPVAVDVGIVPEVVRHGDNGLIVNRNPFDFRCAFRWCAAHIELVREAGSRNAEEMLQTRTWNHVSEQWRGALRHAYRRLLDESP